MAMKKVEKVNQGMGKEKRAFHKPFIPDFEKLLHFIAQAQWIICFYQPGKDK